MKKYSVKQLANLSGVSVRTLHYYDEIGLLKPAFVGDNGYRFYTEVELIKLQQILFFRELDFKLEEIKKMMGAPDFDQEKALIDQKKLLELEKLRLGKLITTLEMTIKSVKGGEAMSNSQRYKAFSRIEVDIYKDEVIQRWGKTVYDQSQKRIAKLMNKDWERINRESESINKGLVEKMEHGFESDEVQKLIGLWFDQVNLFYDCTPETFRGLGKMYVADERFGKYYRKYHQDLPEFMEKAMDYYSQQLEKK